MRKSQILISAWFRGNKVLLLPKLHVSHHSSGGGNVWLFLTVPMSPTAKEALREDAVVGTADPGFREGVEGKEAKRGPCPHAASAGLFPPRAVRKASQGHSVTLGLSCSGLGCASRRPACRSGGVSALSCRQLLSFSRYNPSPLLFVYYFLTLHFG